MSISPQELAVGQNAYQRVKARATLLALRTLCKTLPGIVGGFIEVPRSVSELGVNQMKFTSDGGYFMDFSIPLDILLVSALAIFLLWAWWFVRNGKK